MGVTNFCKLLDCVLPPVETFQHFDSILVDVQSFLYAAIYYSFETREENFIQEVCESVFRRVRELVYPLLRLDAADPHSVTVILSFDGAGVPMKWPTQRERRTTDERLEGKKLIQVSLFGANKISTRVHEYMSHHIGQFRVPNITSVRYVVCGCNVPGEGEHKMFQLAESLGNLRRPVVISLDQDVFLIALARIEHYDEIQIHRYKAVYPLSQRDREYPWDKFKMVSYLFGNDFIPPLVAITDTNGPAIHHALLQMGEQDTSPPIVVARFLELADLTLRYERVDYVNPALLVHFWCTYFWMEDYYRQRNFPQKYMENQVYDRFDRNTLLTGLGIVELSDRAYQEALQTYSHLVTENPPHHLEHVISDPELLDRLRKYWITDESGSERDASCTVVVVTKESRAH